jgi:hypothetical protein
MRHAAGLDDAVLEQGLVAGVVVANELAFPVAEELFRMAPAAGFGEVIDDGL